ncbi:MAG: alanine--tRNA ligase-related protein [Candidatus Gracilibacteria bacterium]|nr:alanine--tRNA ligase-related protein [Candidatus Gracilibacteria bacterium]
MTELQYLRDTYLFRSGAKIVEIAQNEHGTYIVLDRTIFYPQGGGQPSDIGTISNQSGVFQVGSVRIDERGMVYHYGEFMLGSLKKKETVDILIDEVVRITNARNHSAGHLIDVAMKQIGLNHLVATKGYHFPEGKYVEYSGVLKEAPDVVIARLEQTLSDLRERNIPVRVTCDPVGIKAPGGKSPRYVAFEGHEGCGCGGTHVRSSAEIGTILIRKIKSRDGAIRVSYSVE